MADLPIRILHEATKIEPFIVLHKPAGLASAPLKEGDESAYTQAAARYPALNAVSGRKAVEHGLVHRIDTATEGIVLIAASQDFYAHILAAQEEGKFIKTYWAQCHHQGKQALQGFPPPPAAVKINSWREGTVSVCSRFRPYGAKGREVRPVVESSGRAALNKAVDCTYTTEVELRPLSDDSYTATCTIRKGYRHQVRCHLAWIGFPIIGDKVYNADVQDRDEGVQFKATEISFPDLYSDKILHYRID